MEAISLDKVYLTGAIDVKRILRFKAQAIANQHAHMWFEGELDATTGLDYANQSLAGKEMRLVCEVDNVDQSYFAGQIIYLKIVSEGGLLIVHGECVSGSYRFDLVKQSRSFQDTAMTYSEMFQWIDHKDGIGTTLVLRGDQKHIGYPIIQYQETDWEFAKRMASHFNTVVLPEITDGYPQISIGVVEGKHYEIPEYSKYEKGCHVAAFRKNQATMSCSLNNFHYYKVMDYRNFELGDKVSFKGYSLIVMGKEIRMTGALLEVWYELGFEMGYGICHFYNPCISGMSILGEVIYTGNENLKIHLDIDETQDVEKAYKYTWMPQTGDLMYCMPKLGTRVSLYMPDAHERNAYATECVRTNGGSACPEMVDYNVRQFLTEHNKRMTLAPKSLQFVGSSEKNENIVRCEDQKGVFFDSKNPIYFQSEGNIVLNANASVTLNAAHNIHMYKTNSESGIDMSAGEVNITSQKLYHNGVNTSARSSVFIPKSPITPFPFGLMVGAMTSMLPLTASSLSKSEVSVAAPLVSMTSPTLNVTGGLTLEQTAISSANSSRFIGVATGAYLLTPLNSLKKMIENLLNQIMRHPDSQGLEALPDEVQFLQRVMSNIDETQFFQDITPGTEDTLNNADRLARILLHEDGIDGSAAMAWTVYNRTVLPGYTKDGQDNTLKNVLASPGQYEIFASTATDFLAGQADPYKTSTWAKKYDSVEVRDRMKKAIELASVVDALDKDNTLTRQQKKNVMTIATGNPFVDLNNPENEIDPSFVTFFASKGSLGPVGTKNYFIGISGQEKMDSGVHVFAYDQFTIYDVEKGELKKNDIYDIEHNIYY